MKGQVYKRYAKYYETNSKNVHIQNYAFSSKINLLVRKIKVSVLLARKTFFSYIFVS